MRFIYLQSFSLSIFPTSYFFPIFSVAYFLLNFSIVPFLPRIPAPPFSSWPVFNLLIPSARPLLFLLAVHSALYHSLIVFIHRCLQGRRLVLSFSSIFPFSFSLFYFYGTTNTLPLFSIYLPLHHHCYVYFNFYSYCLSYLSSSSFPLLTRFFFHMTFFVLDFHLHLSSSFSDYLLALPLSDALFFSCSSFLQNFFILFSFPVSRRFRP